MLLLCRVIPTHHVQTVTPCCSQNVKYKLMDRQTPQSILLTDDDTLISYTPDDEKALFVNIAPYMNDSVLTVREEYARTLGMTSSLLIIRHLRYSVERTFILFRTMGLRHLPVVNEFNEVVGMITRKVMPLR